MKKLVSEKRALHMLGYVTELYQDAYDAWRTKANRQLEAAAFYRGRQYVQRQRDQLVVDPRGEMAEVVNFCRPLVNAAASRRIKRIPHPKIAARKNDQRSEARARFTEQCALAAIYNGIVDIEQLSRGLIWSAITGAAWIKDFWDPNAGTPTQPQGQYGLEGDEPVDLEKMKDQRELDQFGFPIRSLAYPGEVRTRFIPTTDGLPDPSAKCKEDLRRPGAYFIELKSRTVRELQNEYPRDYFGKPTGRRFIPNEHDTKHSSAWRADDDSEYSRLTGMDANTIAELREVWIMPSDEYPNGLLFVHSGPTILYVGPNPYFPARLPYTILYGDNIVPTSLYPDGLLRDILSQQRVANHMETKKLEIVRKMANPHLLIPFSSGIDKNTWGELPGQTIHYTKGHKPDILPAHDIPQGMFQHTQDQIERAEYITGYTGTSRGEIDSNISGRGIVFANQQEESTRAIVSLLHDQSLVDIMQGVIYHMRQRYDESRFIRTIGVNGMPESIAFKAEDFDWANDFMPVAYDDSPNTHTAKMSELIELKASGFFDQTPEAQRMRKMASGTYAARAEWDPFDKDRTRARREQLALVENPLAPISIQSFDIHRIHLEEHNDFRKSHEYEMWPDWLKSKFDRHCDVHAVLDRFGDGPVMGGEAENALNTATAPPQPMPANSAGQGMESPPDGGAAAMPGPPPSIQEFAQMTDSQQRSSDQR